MDHADYYSLDILKDILVIVNKYTPDEQKQKIKSSKLYEKIAGKYVRVRIGILLNSYNKSEVNRQYPKIQEIDPEYEEPEFYGL